MSERLVIIPTYNEKENAEAIVKAVMALQPSFDLLVVDDGSPDGTADIIRSLRAEFPERLHLLERKGKLGLGTAYIAGFRWALERPYQFIFEMDADFSHNPKDLPRLLEACEKQKGGMSVGSRYVKGGKVKDWSTDRILISYFASIYVNLILWIGVRDCTAGFVCYSRKVLETIDLSGIRFVGYAFQIEMKYKAKRLGFRIAEVPITFIDRTRGESKMNMGIFREAFLGVLKMRFKRVHPATVHIRKP